MTAVGDGYVTWADARSRDGRECVGRTSRRREAGWASVNDRNSQHIFRYRTL